MAVRADARDIIMLPAGLPIYLSTPYVSTTYSLMYNTPGMVATSKIFPGPLQPASSANSVPVESKKTTREEITPIQP